jgi:hypothetical protein
MSGSCLLWSLDGWTQVLKQTAHLATMAYRSIPRVVWNGLRACQWIVSSGARQARCCRPGGCNCAAAAFLLDELSPTLDERRWCGRSRMCSAGTNRAAVPVVRLIKLDTGFRVQ